MSGDWRADRVGSAERGENPMVMARMRSGFVVIADTQVLPGYCLLLGSPKVGRLEDLSRAGRNLYLEDLGLLAEAVDKVCKPKRLNLAILGNLDAYLHAHVIPRYDWEPRDLAVQPIWSFPEVMNNLAGAYDDVRHRYLRDQITEALVRIMVEARAAP